MSSEASRGLYRESYEKDSCGFGLIASLDDQPSNWLVKTAISSLNRLTHRGAIAADGKTGDGCGLLLKKPDVFLRAIAKDAGIKAPTALSFEYLQKPGTPGDTWATMMRLNARKLADALQQP